MQISLNSMWVSVTVCVCVWQSRCVNLMVKDIRSFRAPNERYSKWFHTSAMHELQSAHLWWQNCRRWICYSRRVKHPHATHTRTHPCVVLVCQTLGLMKRKLDLIALFTKCNCSRKCRTVCPIRLAEHTL